MGEDLKSGSITRRDFINAGAACATTLAITETVSANLADSAPSQQIPPIGKPFLTPGKDFGDVSRGDPKPHKLTGDAQAKARLTPDTWRLEITADPFVEEPHTKVPATLAKSLTIADGTALDFNQLLELGKKHEVHFLKAMQCLNIDSPLGQGLWTGVPLREVLKLCGRMNNVRRIYYWGFHNNDAKQVFKSSVTYTNAMETPPNELPVFLAYKLNGEAISPERGGPVRMIVPWSHGYKSIKWLQHIFVTNDPRNNDTYATGNNDPESFLKSAAYMDKSPDGKKFKVGEAVDISGTVISGPSGVKRVEYWVRKVGDKPPTLGDDSPELLQGPWVPCELQEQPDWNNILPEGINANKVLGFDKKTGKALSWPLRYSMCSYSATIKGLKEGQYEVRARSVDLNDFAQPEPRPTQKSGRNGIQVRRFEIT